MVRIICQENQSHNHDVFFQFSFSRDPGVDEGDGVDGDNRDDDGGGDDDDDSGADDILV